MEFQKLVQLITEGSAVRSFACLMLDTSFLLEDIQEDIHSYICPCDVYDDEPGHGLELESHITALYGIHTDKFSEVKSKVNLKLCQFKLKGLSLFKNEKYDVLKFDITSKDLHELNKQLCESLEYTNSYPDYHPHLTVAYLKPGTGKKYTKLKSDIIGQSWTSNTYIFSDKNSNKVYHRC